MNKSRAYTHTYVYVGYVCIYTEEPKKLVNLPNIAGLPLARRSAATQHGMDSTNVLMAEENPGKPQLGDRR